MVADNYMHSIQAPQRENFEEKYHQKCSLSSHIFNTDIPFGWFFANVSFMDEREDLFSIMAWNDIDYYKME